MHITFVDDSFAFDGYGPTSQPLDGPAKAFASLPGALAMRGHKVEVFNRCTFPVNAFGAEWHPFDDERPAATDVLVAFRLPRLLEFAPGAARKILWVPDAPEALDGEAERALLARHRPKVVFLSELQRERWTNPALLDAHVVAPGVGASFLEDEPMAPVEPARAIVTTHPLARLDWVLRLWVEQIRPAVAGAELHVYSALLEKARLGAEASPAIKAVLDQALAAHAHGVVILRPQPEPQMAEAYRAARVHIYPGNPRELLATTLADSQATGLPAVAPTDSPAVLKRIVDGQTGRIANGQAQFTSAIIDLMTDKAQFERMSANARLLQRGRTWAIAAAEFEDVLG